MLFASYHMTCLSKVEVGSKSEMEKGLISLVITLALGLVVSTEIEGPHVTINDTNNPLTPCLQMKATLEFVITYLNNNNENHTAFEKIVLDNVNVNTEKSFCNIKESLASLVVIEDVDDDEESPYSLLFNFTANNKSEVWNFGKMIFTLEDDTLLTEGYNSTDVNFPIEFTTKDTVYDPDNTDISFERSFRCMMNQSLMYSSEERIQPFVNISELQVQVFSFRGKTTGFGNEQDCYPSTNANKIVPIAVGAALAGLVVVVLIAYLIGRLRSRRQSSYEALS